MDTLVTDSSLKINPPIKIFDELNVSNSKVYNTIQLELPDSLKAKLFEVLNTYTKSDNGISEDTIFTVIVTLTIFLLGIIIDRFLKWFNEKGDQKKLRKYFKHYLDFIIDKSCPRLEEAYKKIYQNTTVDNGIPVTPPKILTNDFQRINRIQDKDLFYAISSEKMLAKLRSNLDVIEGITSEIEVYHRFVRKESDKAGDKLTSTIATYILTVVNYVEYLDMHQPQFDRRTEVRELLNNSLLKLYKDKTIQNKVSAAYLKVIRPNQRFLVDNQIYIDNQEARKIIEIGKDVQRDYLAFKSITIQYKMEYRKFCRAIGISYRKLAQARSEVNWD
ncbi:MAG: hypothetical protein KA981_02780 [Bacteroidia bacterium]|nr:hypothetical protein [Bacteroidia bacterium]